MYILLYSPIPHFGAAKARRCKADSCLNNFQSCAPPTKHN